MSRVIDEHRQYLDDVPRLSAFELALDELLLPGQVVLDLASGTGVLGLLACRAGAGRAYSVEVGSIAEVARTVDAAQGHEDRVTFIRGYSKHVELPERVDVLLADQIGNFGFNAGVFDFFVDARRRFLKPDAIVIPSRLDLVVCPVEADGLHGQIRFWDSKPAGFDFSSVRPLAAGTGYQVLLTADQCLGEPAVVASLDTSRFEAGLARGEVVVSVSRDGVLHEVGGWFVAHLSPAVTMTNSPLAAGRIQRRQVYLPIDTPVPVREGDRVRVGMLIRPHESIVSWAVEVRDGATGEPKASERHSSWEATLLDHEELRRIGPDAVPRLTRRGEGRRALLLLCAGAQTVARIERKLLEAFPDLFPTEEEAAHFVAEVVSRYTE